MEEEVAERGGADFAADGVEEREVADGVGVEPAGTEFGAREPGGVHEGDACAVVGEQHGGGGAGGTDADDKHVIIFDPSAVLRTSFRFQIFD